GRGPEDRRRDGGHRPVRHGAARLDHERRTRCGHPDCGCRADPPRLHGPYWQWTRKVAAKTICRWLSPGQCHDYQAWIDNDRRLRELLTRLEALGAAALDADPRSQRKPRTAPRDTGQTCL
ncbi:MAG TPA: DUF6788 family protein, partial [Streptosporangiaceae bacterium]|nr:DUF6788 family protein [Streptosporangiaceae bacterium]